MPATTKIKLRSGSDVDLIDFMGGDDAVAKSAWVSFGNDSDERLQDRTRVRGLINFLYRNQHVTPFESSVFTFRIKTPIHVAREIFRHRSASYNEWSTRYSVMVPEFYIPSADRPLVQQGKPGDYYFVAGDSEQYAITLKQQEVAFQAAWDAYEAVTAAGVAKEVARNVLPLATYTYFYTTVNARNLMHFIELRSDSHALYEIQGVSEQLERWLGDKMPFTHEAFVREQDAAVVNLSNPAEAKEELISLYRRLNTQGGSPKCA